MVVVEVMEKVVYVVVGAVIDVVVMAVEVICAAVV